MSTISHGLADIKKEMQHLPKEQVAELLLRLARFKKDNKDLLAYLLFESHDEAAFIEKVKAEVGFMFSQLPANSYNAAKAMRKILRLIGKYVKFMASKGAEIELLINFCENYLHYADKRTSYKPLRLILTRQLEKISATITKLHEDLQFDYSNDFNELVNKTADQLSWLSRNQYML